MLDSSSIDSSPVGTPRTPQPTTWESRTPQLSLDPDYEHSLRYAVFPSICFMDFRQRYDHEFFQSQLRSRRFQLQLDYVTTAEPETCHQ